MNDPAIDNTPTLESVQEQFEAWRLSRTKREPIFPRHYGKRRSNCAKFTPGLTFAGFYDFPSRILKGESFD